MATRKPQAGPVEERSQADESARRYRVLFENSPHAVFLTAGDNRILAANRAACALFGMTEREICEAPPDRLIENCGRDGWAQGELTCLRNNGEAFLVEAAAVGVDNANHAFVILHDVTDRKRADEARRVSEEHALRRLLEIEAIYDAAPIGLCVLDTELRYVRLNRRLAEIDQLPVEAHLGKSVREVLPAPWADRMEPALRRVIETGEPFPGFEICTKGSGTHRCLGMAGVPLKDDRGRVLGVSLSAEDITDRKRTENALRASEERFRTLGDHLPEAAIYRYRLDDAGAPHVDFVSAGIEHLTGVPPAEYMNDAASGERWILPEDHHRLHEAIALSRDRLTQFEVEVRHRHRTTGEVRWSMMRATPTRNPDGSTIWDGIELDITRRKLAEEALRQSEARYRLLHESLRDAFVQTTVDGRIIECNDLYCEMLGYSPEELRGLSYRELAPERWHAFADRIVREEIIPRGYSGVYEMEYRRKDGAVIPVELRTILSRDAAGQPIAMWALVRDISDRKEAERVLAEAKRRKDLLAEVTARLLASEEPQTLIDDLAAKVMSVLDCQVLFNYLVDVRANRLHLNAWAGIPEQTARDFEHLEFGTAVCGYVAQTGVRLVAEDIPRTPDPRTDSLRPLDVKAFACHPLLARGKVIGTLAFGSRNRNRFSEEDLEVMRAVTDHIAIAMDRARTRDFLQRSESLYRSVARNLPEGMVCVVDPEMRCVCIEGELASRFGLETENIEGRPVLEVVDQAVRPALEANFRHALSGEAASYEMEIRGRLAWSQYTPLRENGNVVGAMMLALDVTERRQAEEHLLHKQKLESIGLLAGGIAHDFNNILTGVIGNTSLALERARPETAALLQSVLKQSERAAHLTRQLLAYSGKGQFFVRNLDISRSTREMSEFLRLSIPKSVELRFAVEERLPSVLMDSGQLQQILMNLVINAGEAVDQDQPPHGSIFVSTGSRQIPAPFIDALGQKAPPGRYVFLEVADNGPGMDAATKARIFDPFFTTKFTGRGLGLAAVSGIVRSLNGAITVDSAPGKGTTFRVFLPSTVGSEDALDNIKPPGDARRTVLVIDDEAYVREFVSQALRQRDYHVVATAGGTEALSVWEALDGRADLVILDVVLPGTGIDVLAEIKRRRSDANVLMTSGYSEAEAKRMCAGYDGIRFIQKPYTAQKLLEEVSRSIET